MSRYGALRVLDLSGNYLFSKTASALREYLGRDDELRELYLRWNEFPDKGVKMIFESLGKN